MHTEHVMMNRTWIARGTIALVGLELALALAYIAAVLRWGASPALFDLNGLRSLPSLLQAAHLFAIGGLCGLLLIKRQRMSRPCSRFLLLALISLCLYGGLDELIKLHLILDQIDWRLVYLGTLAAIPLLSWRDLRWLWHQHRSTLRWIVTGLGIFLLGGFGAEMIKESLAAGIAAQGSERLVFVSEHLRIMVEEYAELLGETVILYAFANFTHTVLRSPTKRGAIAANSTSIV
jgi:hypothetical protein